MAKKVDWHIHSVVSDGVMTPADILATARRVGLKQISITDHDAIGAYRNFPGDLFAAARELGIELISGIELDSDFQGAEIHILGYAFNPLHSGLLEYLNTIKQLRRKKTVEQIAAINAFYGRTVVEEAAVAVPYRDTLMKPHLIHALLEQRLFPDYRKAAEWMAEHIRVATKVPKTDAAATIGLINKAGGKAVLAHPGYYKTEKNVDLAALIRALVNLGLVGIEVNYPYLGTSPAFAGLAAVNSMIAELRRLAARFHLLTTSGSDAHSVEQLVAYHT
jgi:3',5'-nucleoside bisphosphate phosphatase